MEQELRKHRCCFTGHRPEKLNCGEEKVKILLTAAIKQAVADGFTTFITGMARGVDLWAGEVVLQLKRENQNIKIVAASPYKGFEARWSPAWQNLYNAILAKADVVCFICPRYSKGSFQIRNEWMVNRSSRVLAFYNGEPGGTQNTICYAEKCGVPVVNLL